MARRKSYKKYWVEDICPINDSQKEEVARLKGNFVESIELMKFEQNMRVTIDPFYRHIRIGEGDSTLREEDILFKWGPWEFRHIQNWVKSYLNMIGFVEVYHFYARSPIGAIELMKK